MYPYYVKRIEINKTTDQNFYKVTGPKSFIHVCAPYDGNFSISKYVSSLKNYKTKDEFQNNNFIKCSKSDYEENLKRVAGSLGISEPSKLILIESEIRLRKELREKFHKELKSLNLEIENKMADLSDLSDKIKKLVQSI